MPQVLITTNGWSQMPSDAQHSGTVRYTAQFLDIHHTRPGASTPRRTLTSKEARKQDGAAVVNMDGIDLLTMWVDITR
jgi:hypothetical protein